jgi:hypothetical protein
VAESRRGGRKFAPLPDDIVKVRLSGSSAPRVAEMIAAIPGVKIVTGPDEYSDGRLYLTVTLTGEAPRCQG